MDDEPDRISRVHRERRWSNENQKKQNSCRNSRFMLTLLKLFDYRLLKQFEFKILVASAFLFPMGFNIPFVYSSARTTIPVEYARMIGPIIGISNLVMRNILGILAYKRRSWTLGLCGCGLIFGGVSVLISAFYGENLIWFQFLYGFSYAVAPGVYIYLPYLSLQYYPLSFPWNSCLFHTERFDIREIPGTFKTDQRFWDYLIGHGNGRLYWDYNCW